MIGPARNSLQRWLLWTAGSGCLGLAGLGAVLPGLPTTPFVLLAAACFVRSSPSAYRRLRHNRFFGPILADWETHRGVSRRTKLATLAVVAPVLALSIGLAPLGWPLRAAIALAGAMGLIVVCRLPVVERSR